MTGKLLIVAGLSVALLVLALFFPVLPIGDLSKDTIRVRQSSFPIEQTFHAARLKSGRWKVVGRRYDKETRLVTTVSVRLRRLQSARLTWRLMDRRLYRNWGTIGPIVFCLDGYVTDMDVVFRGKRSVDVPVVCDQGAGGEVISILNEFAAAP